MKPHEHLFNKASMTALSAVSAALAFSCAGNAAAVLPAENIPQSPNVLYLFADDLTFDALGAAGNREVKTPNIDQLAQEGTLFSQAHIRGAICCAVSMPSRAMMLTGRDLYEINRDGTNIPKEDTTLPQTFLEQGYETFGTGKWHNGKESFYRSFSNGGNIFFGGMHDHFQTPVHAFDPSGRYRSTKPLKRIHSSELFAQATIDFIDEYESERPFFAYVSFTAPHDPRTAPAEFHQQYPPQNISIPQDYRAEPVYDTGELKIRDEGLAPFPRTEVIFQQQHSDYYAMISHLDQEVGRIIDSLKKSGRYENTIIVFTADNGLSVGRHGLMGKQHLYEESIRVPLIMTGPGIKAAQQSGTRCFLQDIFPTLCGLIDINVPASVSFGESFLSSFNDVDYQFRDEMVFGYKNFMRSVKNDRWKLIAYNVNGQRNYELFDLINDPFEMNNLAENENIQNQFNMMIEILKKKMIETNDFCDFSKPDWGYPHYVAWEQATSFYTR